jgi:hypothetical protein
MCRQTYLKRGREILRGLWYNFYFLLRNFSGVGEATEDLRYDAINYARKKAVTEARKSNFANFISHI